MKFFFLFMSVSMFINNAHSAELAPEQKKFCANIKKTYKTDCSAYKKVKTKSYKNVSYVVCKGIQRGTELRYYNIGYNCKGDTDIVYDKYNEMWSMKYESITDVVYWNDGKFVYQKFVDKNKFKGGTYRVGDKSQFYDEYMGINRDNHLLDLKH